MVGVAGLFYYGTQGGTRYEQAKLDYEEALSEATSMEKTVPYPTAANRNGKQKAIEDFKKDVESLQGSFSSYRPGELRMVSPQEFVGRLIEVNQETRKEFELNAVAVPEAFFVGFKDYTGKLPNKSSTGILSYQLEAIRGLLVLLAQSGASELKNLHRPLLGEEEGKIYQPADDAVARPLSVEITFKGPERSLRKFMSELAQNQNHYWVTRSLRVGNMKMEPPKTADAKFDAPAVRDQQDNVFQDVFRFDNNEGGENTGQPVEGEQPAAAPAAPAAAPAVKDGDRILALIVGNEELLVHMRLDLLMFLEPKPLP